MMPPATSVLDRLLSVLGGKEFATQGIRKLLKTDGWAAHPIEIDGERVGQIWTKENEVHVDIESTARLHLTKGVLERGLNQLFERREFLVTRTFHGDQFPRRMGFARTHSDETFIYWWKSKGDS